MEPFGNGATLHHVGYVVASIQSAAEGFMRSLALTWDGQIIHDPALTVNVSFLYPRLPGSPTIELVEPEGSGSVVHKFLQRGGGLHHLCYEVDCLESQMEFAKVNRDLLVRPLVQAVAFQGRRVAWIYTRNKFLVEYVERCPK
jgi:methylmalonyl-CoA/ethylmalonyl-CoA epimerase